MRNVILFLRGCGNERAVRALLVGLLVLCSGERARGQYARLSGVIYMDQPTGIELSIYVATWPQLEGYKKRLMQQSQFTEVEADLRLRAQTSGVSDGELNLLAQLEWQRGALDDADLAAGRAVSLQPKQPLNWFQSAMVNFAHLRRATGNLERWKWQQRTRDAYQRTFALDPKNVSARYYLAYSYMNTPAIGGGDKKKALELSQAGIDLGQDGFYAVRADAHRLRGEIDAANADYDRAIELRVIKLGGFLDAAAQELERKHWERAKRYLDWALHCRPDATQAYEGLGDYFVAVKDWPQATHAYQLALQQDSKNLSAGKKLARLSQNN
jgi:tetratricopeptide (TPR) repeat protein